MNIQDVMKLYGLNAAGAKKRLASMQAMEPDLFADSASSADSEKSAKLAIIYKLLDTYSGELTKEGIPTVDGMENLLNIDFTSDTRTTLWNKYLEQKSD